MNIICYMYNTCVKRNDNKLSFRVWKLYKKVHTHADLTEPFIKPWVFSRDNVEAMWNRLNKKDQQLFEFQMKKFDWTKYFVNHYMGIRLYLLNEDESTLEVSRIRYKR